MSSLSWLIFFVGFCENVSNYFGWIIGIFCVVTVGLTILKLVISTDDSDEAVRVQREFGKVIYRWMIFAWVGAVGSIAFQIILPTKQTAVLIAASEVGQQVLQSQQAQAVGNKVGSILGSSSDLLQTWIDKETFKQRQQLQELAHTK